MKRHPVLIICIAVFLVCVLGLVAAVTVLGGGFGAASGSLRRIQTDSMAPTLESGDWIWCENVDDPEDLEVGDIITYWTVINGMRVLNTHRIVAIYDHGDYLVFETKGDNNTVADALMVHEAEIVGVYRLKLPF